MKISELAAYRENLESLRPRESLTALAKELDPVVFSVQHHAIQMPVALAGLEDIRRSIYHGMENFDQQIQSILDDLLQKIEGLEPSYLARSYQLYESMMQQDTIDYILDRRFPIDPQIKTYIQSRVQAHSDYHHPGMIIRPGKEEWIEHMVACDPLYVIDTHHDLFLPTKEKFNPTYQSRLRYYAVKESSEQPILDLLPDNQFGFVFAYNFFHYKPFEIMRAYLREIYHKLKPGGVLGMTFTDCNRRGGVELAERMMNCYTPGRLVIGACEAVGFVIEQNYKLDAAVNWAELRKPGRATSLRGGQTLAKIVAKSK